MYEFIDVPLADRDEPHLDLFVLLLLRSLVGLDVPALVAVAAVPRALGHLLLLLLLLVGAGALQPGGGVRDPAFTLLGRLQLTLRDRHLVGQ